MADESFFPPYLDKGSEGWPVVLLQCWLIDNGYNADNIVVDGKYGEQTAEGVRQLQEDRELETDGNFGPATRKAIVKLGGIDFNSIPASAFSRPTIVVGPD